MRSDPWYRLVALVLLLAVLVGLFVWAGTVQPDPADNNYPDTDDVHEDPDRYLGERVTVGGTVIDTDPLTIEEEPTPGERITFVVKNADPDVEVGDTLRVFGTLQQDNRVHAINTVSREPWEAQYMYVVSFLGGLWVLGRIMNEWMIDTTSWSVVPRTDSLLTKRT